jgi:hypothetical protein
MDSRYFTPDGRPRDPRVTFEKYSRAAAKVTVIFMYWSTTFGFAVGLFAGWLMWGAS